MYVHTYYVLVQVGWLQYCKVVCASISIDPQNLVPLKLSLHQIGTWNEILPQQEIQYSYAENPSNTNSRVLFKSRRGMWMPTPQIMHQLIHSHSFILWYIAMVPSLKSESLPAESPCPEIIVSPCIWNLDQMLSSWTVNNAIGKWSFMLGARACYTFIAWCHIKLCVVIARL